MSELSKTKLAAGAKVLEEELDVSLLSAREKRKLVQAIYDAVALQATPAPQAAPSDTRQPIIGRLMDAISNLPVLWGLNEPGALLRNSDVQKVLVEVGKEYAAPAVTQAAPSEPVAKTGYVMMPARLTAENGAKGALSGEFKESITVTCHECEGSGEHVDGVDDANCPACNGNGTVDQDVPVTWDTIKEIYKAAVALLSAPLAAQQSPADARDAALPEQIKAAFKAWFDSDEYIAGGDPVTFEFGYRAAIAAATTSTEGR